MKQRKSGILGKIVVRLSPDAWHGHSTETIWAELVDVGRYKVRSVPFFAQGLSFEDVVLVRGDEDQPPIVEKVVLHSGHSTYRIFLGEGMAAEDARFKEHWEKLERLGCTYERATARLFAIDVPPGTDIHLVYKLLEEGELAGIWAFEEGHCGHC